MHTNSHSHLANKAGRVWNSPQQFCRVFSETAHFTVFCLRRKWSVNVALLRIHGAPLFFCGNGVEISTDIYSFGFIRAFRIDRWRHPPLSPPSDSLSSSHRTYLWYVSVQCANCAFDTHPSGSVNVCVLVYICMYSVQGSKHLILDVA